MNVNEHAILFSTIAADRRQALIAASELRGLRRQARLEAKASRRAAALAAATSTGPAFPTAPIQIRSAAGPVQTDTVLESGDLEHACARVA